MEVLINESVVDMFANSGLVGILLFMIFTSNIILLGFVGSILKKTLFNLKTLFDILKEFSDNVNNLNKDLTNIMIEHIVKDEALDQETLRLLNILLDFINKISEKVNKLDGLLSRRSDE